MPTVSLVTLAAHAQAHPKDADFCTSLIAGLRRYGSLTDRQHAAAERMLDRATSPTTAAGEPPRPPAAPVLPGAASLVAWFGNASKSGLKKPRITLTVDGASVQFSLAPSTGKNPGCVYTKVNGEYRGRLLSSGAYIGFGGDSPEVKQVLSCKSDDLLSLAIAHGHATGNCSFCGLTLTDPRSVAKGYGPICAQRWNLPWGD
jgi:hypothetical protein